MSKDYKSTLNLPQTSFPMKANLPNREPEQLSFWQEIDVYQQTRDARKDCEKFFIHDGPPYANGQIHIGHAVNKVLKDIVTKSHLLDGYDSPYIPGWDCHGLPIEVNVEKKHGKAGVKVSHQEFRRLCREYAKEQVENQKKDFLRLGIIGDWSNPYLTMDYQIEADTIRALGTIMSNGYFRRGDKPVHWCFDCKSALAEAEVEYSDKKSDSIDVFFALEDQKKVLELTGLSSSNLEIGIAIWTTTPWTLPANNGLSLNPDFSYQVVRTKLNDKPVGLIVSEELSDSCKQRWNKENDWEVIASGISGSVFENLTARHPIYDRPSLCMLGNHVTLETGTGIVHTSLAYGQDDFIVGQRYNLKVDNPVLDNGVYDDKLPIFGGMHIYKANPLIIEKLKENHALINHEQITHSFPHCWRHNTPIIQRATPQWFISMRKNNLSQKVLDKIKKVHWTPSWGESRIQSMVEKRPDWCISRQRSWGSPITLLLHKVTGEPHPRSSELIELIAQKVSHEGIEGWFSLKVEDLLPTEEAKDYKKSNDTLDVWFDSGTTHHTVLQKHKDLHYPADVYLEGSDQHRGWFQSSLISAVAMNGTAPYKNVITHGFVVDKDGRKMSKSIGNIIAPQEIVDQMGADVLRLWIASTDYSNEMSISKDILKQSSDIYRRIRNTIRFLLANVSDFDVTKDSVASESMVAIDLWAIENARLVQSQVTKSYAQYNYAKAVQDIYNFCSADLGGFYLDIIKDRLYTAKKDGSARHSAQTALWHLLESLCRWIAPILSFTAEEVWRTMPQRETKTVFAAKWHQLPKDGNMKVSMADWNKLKQIKNQVNKHIECYRLDNKIGSALDLRVSLRLDQENYRLLSQISSELPFLFICSQTNIELLEDNATDEKGDKINLECTLEQCSDNKCARCWQRLPEVGKIEGHEELCQRCVDNLCQGESRRYV